MNKTLKSTVFAMLLILVGFAAHADESSSEPKTYELTIKDHKFEPAELRIPADKAAILVVKNLDNSPEEFESHKLKIEKIITGGGEGTFRLRPLAAGEYKFEGEFNPETAQGVIIAE